MTTEQNQAGSESIEQPQNEQPSTVDAVNDATDAVNTDQSQNAADTGENGELEAELAKAQASVKDYWEQIVRLNAEIENNRKRAQRDIENAHKFAVKQFVESLLPVTDSMEMGMDAAKNENATLDSIREGMQMTLDMFLQTLQKSGIERIDPIGEKFDPELHQAMTLQESNEHDPNTVLLVMQKGYVLNQRLIRPAMVIVSKAGDDS
jgi:molecular chaperone GrpE